MAIPTKEDILKLIADGTKALLDSIEGLFSGVPAGEPAIVDPGAPPEESTDLTGLLDLEADKLAAKLSQEKFAVEWEKLSSENKIPKTSREQFLKVATANGLDFAKDLFINALPKPLEESKLKSDNKILNDKEKRVAEYYERFQIKNRVKNAYEKKLQGGK